MGFRLEHWIGAGAGVPGTVGEPGEGQSPDRVLSDLEMEHAQMLAAAAAQLAAPYGEAIVSVIAEHDESGSYLKIQPVNEPLPLPNMEMESLPDLEQPAADLDLAAADLEEPPADLRSSPEPAAAPETGA